jgi:hypothetical protein
VRRQRRQRLDAIFALRVRQLKRSDKHPPTHRITIFGLPVEVGNTSSWRPAYRVTAFHARISSPSSGWRSTTRTPASVFDRRTWILPLGARRRGSAPASLLPPRCSSVPGAIKFHATPALRSQWVASAGARRFRCEEAPRSNTSAAPPSASLR